MLCPLSYTEQVRGGRCRVIAYGGSIRCVALARTTPRDRLSDLSRQMLPSSPRLVSTARHRGTPSAAGRVLHDLPACFRLVLSTGLEPVRPILRYRARPHTCLASAVARPESGCPLPVRWTIRAYIRRRLRVLTGPLLPVPFGLSFQLVRAGKDSNLPARAVALFVTMIKGNRTPHPRPGGHRNRTGYACRSTRFLCPLLYSGCSLCQGAQPPDFAARLHALADAAQLHDLGSQLGYPLAVLQIYFVKLHRQLLRAGLLRHVRQ